jgi:hypothetical protein
MRRDTRQRKRALAGWERSEAGSGKSHPAIKGKWLGAGWLDLMNRSFIQYIHSAS